MNPTTTFLKRCEYIHTLSKKVWFTPFTSSLTTLLVKIKVMMMMRMIGTWAMLPWVWAPRRREERALASVDLLSENTIVIIVVWIAQCVHCTVFFPFDRARWDLSSNLKPVMLLNIYLSQRTRSKGTLRKVDFREPQTLNLWFSLKYSPVVTTNYAPLFPCNSPLAMGI